MLAFAERISNLIATEIVRLDSIKVSDYQMYIQQLVFLKIGLHPRFLLFSNRAVCLFKNISRNSYIISFSFEPN